MNTVATHHISAGAPSLHGNERQYVNDVLDRGWLTQGKYVAAFEEAFAAYIGTRFAFATSNGTSALHLALLAAGVKTGDEVIVPACTFIATANAVTYCGAKAVIVDVDPATWNLDPAAVEKTITARTVAIIPVHVYGSPAPMTELRRIAEWHGLTIIEDAAEALGAEYDGCKAGAMGKAAAFSFYGNKTITTGEGGMVVTDDEHVAERVFSLRGQGQIKGTRYLHSEVGFNYRMTDLQAAVGLAQLEQIGDILARRAMVALRYANALKGVVRFQENDRRTLHGNWAIAALLDRNSSSVMSALARAGIETRPVFPPLHRQAPYLTPYELPVATLLHDRGLVLPTHAELSESEVAYVCETLKETLD